MATPPCRLCSARSACYCSCENPPIPCCHPCSYVHHETPGTHNWAMFTWMGVKNASCAICQERSAEVVCCCNFPLVFLCVQCRSHHVLKGSSIKMHLEQPIEKAELITSLADIERARRVLENKDRIEEYLKKNKAAASKLKGDVAHFAEELIARIVSEKEETLKNIKEVESAIEEIIITLKQEVKMHLFEMKVESSNELVKEAFDTSKHFACSDVLRRELSRCEPLGSRLATLHIPPFIQRSALGSQQASQARERQLPDAGYLQDGSQEVPHTYPAACLPVYSQTVPDNPLELYAQWPLQGGSNPDEYGLYSREASQLNSTASVPLARHQELSSAQFATHRLQEQHSQSIESNPFEVTQEMRDKAHAPCYGDCHGRTPEIPITIGLHRLPIELMQDKFKKSDLAAQKLQVFSFWRKSRIGSSFFRCVGVLLCEHYCRPDTPIAEVAASYKSMVDQSLPFQLISDSPDILSNVDLWQQLLRDIYMTRTRGENAFQRLQYFLQLPKFDKAISITVRNYTAACFRLHANDPEISEFLLKGPEQVIQEIMKDGCEAEGITLKFAAQAFNIILHIYILDVRSGQISETTYGPKVKGLYPSMHLFHYIGHYNYLVPRAWVAADRYDFASNTYDPVPTQTLIDYEEYVPPD